MIKLINNHLLTLFLLRIFLLLGGGTSSQSSSQNCYLISGTGGATYWSNLSLTCPIILTVAPIPWRTWGVIQVLPKFEVMSLFTPQFIADGKTFLRSCDPALWRNDNIELYPDQNTTCVICTTKAIGVASGYVTGVFVSFGDTSNVKEGIPVISIGGKVASKLQATLKPRIFPGLSTDVAGPVGARAAMLWLAAPVSSRVPVASLRIILIRAGNDSYGQLIKNVDAATIDNKRFCSPGSVDKLRAHAFQPGVPEMSTLYVLTLELTPLGFVPWRE